MCVCIYTYGCVHVYLYMNVYSKLCISLTFSLPPSLPPSPTGILSPFLTCQSAS